MVDKKLNLWHIDLNNNEELTEQIDLMLVNPFEFPMLLLVLHISSYQKLQQELEKHFFPTNSVEIYDKCDVLITADPKLLKNKPINKIVVKIETDYNKEEESDFTYKTLTDFLEDKEIINKLIEIYNRL